MATPRPPLTDALDPETFTRWYWLKAELQAFCRKAGISATGNKLELMERVRSVLSGKPIPHAIATRRPRTEIPEQLTADTVIGGDWHCSQALREYFKSVHGPRFSFNGALREFIAHGQGKTLSQASACYIASRGRITENIAPQFEFNRHIREYFASHPDATREEAVSAWWARRGKLKP